MSLKSQSTKTIFFFLLLIVPILFYLWSQLFWVTLAIVFIIDLLSAKFSLSFFKRNLKANNYKIIQFTLLILLPFALAVFIRTFLLDIYFVPSSSMQSTLFPNDYVLVNKVSYGTKIPNRVVDVPVIGSLFTKDIKSQTYNLYRPLNKFSDFKREDIVVFKSVTDDAKFLIKRIIGMPGDTLLIKNAIVKVNNQLLEDHPYYCYSYIDSTQRNMPMAKNYSNKEYDTLNKVKKMRLFKNILTQPSQTFFVFPYEKKLWTRDNYGPIIIPKKGVTLKLNNENINVYKNILKHFEDEDIRLFDNDTITYTFKNNYYFMMGDNRHASIDSRFFGFVPESYIQGKLVGVF